jgi:sugar phosphate isomerase/epimerase
MGANFVAQQIGWRMTEGWSQGQKAAEAWYRPESTFSERFDEFVGAVRDLGFTVIDLWTGQLHWGWATEEQIRTAKKILDARGVAVASYAGYFGDTAADVERAGLLARSVGTDILGGNTRLLREDREDLVPVLESTGTRLGFENHPDEKDAADVLTVIDRFSSERVGACLDTGWFGTHGTDAPEALGALFDRLIHLHLKDVFAAGAHDTCTLGDGVVDVEACARFLAERGWDGTISVEHEPEDRDPTPEIVLSRQRLLSWIEG